MVDGMREDGGHPEWGATERAPTRGCPYTRPRPSWAQRAGAGGTLGSWPTWTFRMRASGTKTRAAMAAPVVFLHAFTGNTEAWEYQAPAFADAGYRCVRYDRRGWGRSRDSSTAGQETYASDDLHALVEHLGIARFHLVGTGGGRVCRDGLRGVAPGATREPGGGVQRRSDPAGRGVLGARQQVRTDTGVPGRCRCGSGR